MSMRAYVLVEAAMGKAASVAAGVHSVEAGTVRLVSADVATGPFDVIVLVETDDLDVLARWVTEGIQAIDGVQRTITCVAR
jgi:DNA-binding Lrp family transcriptional regulator